MSQSQYVAVPSARQAKRKAPAPLVPRLPASEATTNALFTQLRDYGSNCPGAGTEIVLVARRTVSIPVTETRLPPALLSQRAAQAIDKQQQQQQQQPLRLLGSGSARHVDQATAGIQD